MGKNAFMDHDSVIHNLSKKRKLDELKKRKKQKIMEDKLLPFAMNESDEQNKKDKHKKVEFNFGFNAGDVAENECAENKKNDDPGNGIIIKKKRKKKKDKTSKKKKKKRIIQL